ncbi:MULTISPECIES: hypothetical protein [Iodidimonas]|uniref:Uncharacterized protein n=1 Tax=Iodidimonas nitroreducens TaxID=1236968 RepID=A0A5A7N9X7_9PROT|nr:MULTISPECIES: hypothetical protein [Iodidimonas]GAK33959.1 hypothetical protein AQ1_01853 [alpha proteobacterium Q-1]GER03879.1 hypothetical protein JCM17846_15610 [Iodidimonas nitroreducens]
MTLILMGAALGLLGLATLGGRRAYVPGKPPLIPYGALQFLAILLILLFAGHLITLITGQPFRGRLG